MVMGHLDFQILAKFMCLPKISITISFHYLRNTKLMYLSDARRDSIIYLKANSSMN